MYFYFNLKEAYRIQDNDLAYYLTEAMEKGKLNYSTLS